MELQQFPEPTVCLAKHLKALIVEARLALDAVVIVEFDNQMISVIGEVNSPGKYRIDRDRLTILDAISMAGDLTIQGRRNNIMVLREEYGAQKAYTLDLNNAQQFYSSPAFYLQQNDIVYVEPNSTRAGQSGLNTNTVRSTSFWMSLTSLIMTVITFVTR
jgi:polysaccharide export outer membrane protein